MKKIFFCFLRYIFDECILVNLEEIFIFNGFKFSNLKNNVDFNLNLYSMNFIYYEKVRNLVFKN